MEYDEWYMEATRVVVEYLFERFDLDRDRICEVLGDIFSSRFAALRKIGYFYVPEDEENPGDYGLEQAQFLAITAFNEDHSVERVERVVRSWMVNSIYRKWDRVRYPKRQG
jgi:hypothetical protein